MHYKNPSIVEALCEVAFRPRSRWDMTVFGRFYDLVRDSYPNREAGEAVETDVGKVQGGIRQQVRHSPRMRFFSSDRNRVLQVGPNLLVANVLRPYPGWASFKPDIIHALSAYYESADPDQIEHLTLRYIDRLEIPRRDFHQLDKWIACDGSTFPRRLASTDQGLAFRLETVDTPFRRLDIALGLGFPDRDADCVVLMLDMSQTRLESRSDSAGRETLLDEMHGALVMTFENCIRDPWRNLMGPLTEQAK